MASPAVRDDSSRNMESAYLGPEGEQGLEELELNGAQVAGAGCKGDGVESSNSSISKGSEAKLAAASEYLGPRGTVSWQQASVCLIIVVIGAGIMALPILPKKGGIILSFLFLAICALAIHESGMAMWRGIMVHNKAGHGSFIVSYDDFARAGWGTKGEIVLTVFMNIFFIGLVAAFCDLTAESLRQLSGEAASERVFLLCIAPVLALLAQCPNMSMLAKLAPVGVVAAFAICFLIIGKSAADSHVWMDWTADEKADLHQWGPSGALDLGIVLATIYGAFGCVANVPSIMSEMREPEHFPRALSAAMVVIISLYALVMGMGYFAYGDFMRPDIIQSMSRLPADYDQAFNMPFSDWTGARSPAVRIISSCLVIVKLLISMPVCLMVVFNSLQTSCMTKEWLPAGSVANRLVRLFVVLLVIAIAIAVPSFTQVFPLFMSITGPVLQSLLPLLISARLQRMAGAPGAPLWRQTVHGLVILLCILSLTLGFYGSLENIISS